MGRWRISNALIDMGIDTNIAQGDDYADKNLITPLIIAVNYENPSMDTILKLLKKGADPNRADKSGRTPISVAISHELLNVVEVLIENGAETNKQIIYQIALLENVQKEEEKKEKEKKEKEKEDAKHKGSWNELGGGRKIRKLYNKRKTRKLHNKRRNVIKSFTKSKNKYSKKYHN